MYVKREDFLNLLRDHQEDYEKFCFLKDSLTLYKNFGSINEQCFSCKEKNHDLIECPYFNIRKNKIGTISKYKRGYQDKRKKKIVRTEIRENSLLNQFELEPLTLFY